MTLGEKIKKVRRDANLTQDQVAEKVGFTRQALSKIEKNKGEPERENLIKLARILKNDFGENWLVEFINEPENADQKAEVIGNASPKEILTLKFGGKNTRRSKAEAQELRDLLDAELEKWQSEE